MKVRETLVKPSDIQGVPGKEERKVSESKDSGFQNQLRRIEDQNYEERINNLVKSIVEQGDKLSKKVDIKELKIYKKLVSEFLDEAVGNSHKFSKRNLLDRRGRHRVYAVVKKINEQLDKLTEDVLAAQKDNIGILQKLDDIRGLILDIVM